MISIVNLLNGLNLSKKSEDYCWCSMGYHVQTNNKDLFLSFDFGLKELGVIDEKERLRRFRRFIYETGSIESGKGARITVSKARKQKFKYIRIDRFKQKTRYFIDSRIIGSKEFVRENFLQFKHFFQNKIDRFPNRVSGLDGIYSLKRLTNGWALNFIFPSK